MDFEDVFSPVPHGSGFLMILALVLHKIICIVTTWTSVRHLFKDIRSRVTAIKTLFHHGDLTFGVVGCGLGQGVGGLEGPRAGVDGLCCLCCCAVVGGPFAGGQPSVFQHSPSLLVRWVNSWG